VSHLSRRAILSEVIRANKDLGKLDRWFRYEKGSVSNILLVVASWTRHCGPPSRLIARLPAARGALLYEQSPFANKRSRDLHDPFLFFQNGGRWMAGHLYLETHLAHCQAISPEYDKMEQAHYSPPWADTSIIGIAGSSGSGKTSLALEIVSSLNLPWVVILSMVNHPQTKQ